MENLEITPFCKKHKKAFQKIYKISFSKEERFPVVLLFLNILRKKAQMFLLLENKEVVGFLYSISYKKENFLLYLAIHPSKREKGYGSYLLNWYCKNSKGKNIYLNIEEVNPSFFDYEVRKKRLNFYLANSFYDTGYIGIEEKKKCNILALKKEFSLEEYRKLDKKISHAFLCKKATIIKNK